MYLQLHSCSCLSKKLDYLEQLEVVLKTLLSNSNIIKDERLYTKIKQDAYIPISTALEILQSENDSFTSTLEEFTHNVDHIESIKMTVTDDNETLIKLDYSNRANIFKVTLK